MSKEIFVIEWPLATFSACLTTEEEVEAELAKARAESNFVIRFEGVDNGMPYTCVVYNVQWELREKTDEPKSSHWSEGVPIVEGEHCTIVKMGTGLPLIPTGGRIEGSDAAEEKLGAAIQKLKRLGFTDAQAQKALLDGTALPYLQHDESLPFSPTGIPVTKL